MCLVLYRLVPPEGDAGTVDAGAGDAGAGDAGGGDAVTVDAGAGDAGAGDDAVDAGAGVDAEYFVRKLLTNVIASLQVVLSPLPILAWFIKAS